MNIFNFRIGKAKFRFHSENGVFYAENNSRNSFFSLLFFGMMIPFIFSGFFMLNNNIDFNFGLFVGFVIHPIFGIIGLRKFLWLVRGKEILTIDNEYLKISKVGSFWIKDKIFEKKEIKNIRDKFEDEIYLKNRPKWYNETMNSMKENQRLILYFTIGEILFDYKFSTIKVFSSLNESERKLLIEEVKKQIER
ncbi:hypothetical protein FLGE108171_15650 [Flavobacterium gelidilacus]|uniref:hypothetical protein n=1 Tax=Flavobacterium gelidilacus TaxID=206041 RepID=UPI0003FEFE52|nr:hypothetical protein [Flavobacterium gelidilacus]